MSVARRRRLPGVLDPYSTSFRLLSDTLLAGLLVLALSLPVVTWFAALTGATAALRDARAAEDPIRVRRILGHGWSAVRRHPLLTLLAPAVFVAFILADLLVLPHLLGDATLALWALGAIASGVGAFALRIAGAWRADRTARGVLALAWGRMSADPVGTLMLFGACAAAALIVSFSPPLVLVIGGPLALAALAFDRDVA